MAGRVPGRAVLAAVLLLSCAGSEAAGRARARARAWDRRALGSTSSAEPAPPPVPVDGYERLEIGTPFVPLAVSGCAPSCEASLGARLSGVRADMASTMGISAPRIQIGGVAASVSGTYVYFTVATETGATITERTPEEAKIALSAATTVTGDPLQLDGLDVSKYTVSGNSLPCTYCLYLQRSCEATHAQVCAGVVLDGVAATCTGAGECSHAQATAQTAERCTATDTAACATADLDGLSSTCTAAGSCTYFSSIINVTVSYLEVDVEESTHAPLGVPFTFMMISLMLGTFVKTLIDLIPMGAYHPPYSVMIFTLGMVCAQMDHSFNSNGEISEEIHESIEYWLAVDPHVIMFGLLPPLLFESAFGVDFHVFAKVAAMAIIMALPGVIVATGCTAAVSMLFFSGCCDVGLWHCILLGSVLSATDPVAVVGVLNTLGAPAHLKHMIEGESLLNDGSAFVIFLISQQMMNPDNQLTGGEMVAKFLRLAGGGVLWGLIAGYIAFYWCKLSKHASVVDVAVLVLCTYMVFYIGEHGLHVSGVLAAVTFGILFSRLAPHAMSEHVIHANHVVFSQICHFAETHIFVLAGLIIYHRFFITESHIDKSLHAPLGIAMYAAVHAIRGGVIALFSPLLSRLGYGITVGEGIMMTYGGLRGAVSLAMALLLDADLSVDIAIRDLVVFHTGMIVVLTVVINGMTAGSLYNYLNMYPANAFRKELRERGLQFLAAEALQIVEAMKGDWFHEPADAATLMNICPDFSKAKLKYGDIHVPHVSIDHIFFGYDGYVHRNLFGWRRAANVVKELTRHAHTPHDSDDALNGEVVSGIRRTQTAPNPNSKSSTLNTSLNHNVALLPDEVAPHHDDEVVPDIWIGGIPQYHANEACLRESFEPFGAVALIYYCNKPDKASTNEPRSWAFLTFEGDAEARSKAVAAAMLHPSVVQTEEQESIQLKVERADRDKTSSHKGRGANIWDQMAQVSGARALNLKSQAISAATVEEAKMLMYEICFTALGARYAEMVHHQLISMKTLDRLQEALKKGQDVLVQLRDPSTDSVSLPNPIYLGWNDNDGHGNDTPSFRISLSGLFTGKRSPGRPESLTSVKNFVRAKNHHQEMSISRFKHIEDLMLCAEMTWAVREAHHEVVFHVLHGEIVDTKDAHILQARGQVAQEMRQVVRESEVCLEGMHKEHRSMMNLVHTVIASRATLHTVLNKIDMLVHKGFFDNRDQASLEHVIGERMLQLEKAFDHGPMRLAYRELVRYCCHRKKPLVVPHSGMSGVLKGELSKTHSFKVGPLDQPVVSLPGATSTGNGDGGDEERGGVLPAKSRLPSLQGAPTLP